MGGFLKKAKEKAWSNAFSSFKSNLVSGAQRASTFEDFLNKSGLNAKAKAYQKAYDAAPTKRQETTDRFGDTSYEYVKDTSGISTDLKNASLLIGDTEKLREQYNSMRNEYGTVTENADAGASYTGNVSSVGDSGNGAVSSGRRQGGDQITGDSARSNDSRGGDTLLGYSGRNTLKEKDTLF